jgi:hypothetical protein
MLRLVLEVESPGASSAWGPSAPLRAHPHPVRALDARVLRWVLARECVDPARVTGVALRCPALGVRAWTPMRPDAVLAPGPAAAGSAEQCSAEPGSRSSPVVTDVAVRVSLSAATKTSANLFFGAVGAAGGKGAQQAVAWSDASGSGESANQIIEVRNRKKKKKKKGNKG